MAVSIDDFPRTSVFKAWPGRALWGRQYLTSVCVHNFLFDKVSYLLWKNLLGEQNLQFSQRAGAEFDS